MKLYYDPASTTCRPVMLFAAEHGLALDSVHIDLFAGEHRGDAYLAINPNGAVPVLEDGDFRLCESSAILKYLADRLGSPAYPAELKARARVNEAMDWFNTSYSFSMNYLHVYPQMLPEHMWQDPAIQAQVTARGLAWGRDRLDVLDRHMLQDAFVCGPELTVADYLGGVYVGLSEAIAFDLSPWPRVAAWMARTTWHYELRAGDTLLLYTDGLIEVPGTDLTEGMTALAAHAEQARDRGLPLAALCERLLASVAERRDDAAVIGFRPIGQRRARTPLRPWPPSAPRG